MKKITTYIVIISFIWMAILSGCTEKHVDAPLNTLGLKIEDLEGNYEKIHEAYITEPYIMGQTFPPLEGQKILEYYNSTFKGIENTGNIIEQNLFRCESNEKAQNYVDIIKSAKKTLYPEKSIQTIGEKSYFGVLTTTISGTNINAYLLVFSIGDVLVILGGITPTQYIFTNYGKIIQNNIIKATYK